MLTKIDSSAQTEVDGKQLFETIYQQHYPRVYGILLRLMGDEADAQDVAQHVFMKLYSPQQLRLPDDEAKMTSWLYRIAVNEGYNALRSQKRRASWLEKFDRLGAFSRSAPDPAHLVERQDDQAKVRQILAQLKPRDAKLLLLRHAGLSYKEIAETLNIAPGSVGSLLTQARRTFAKKYQAAFPEEV
jgi:RNA polymerase sigma-70 factor (ECF subfamily)